MDPKTVWEGTANSPNYRKQKTNIHKVFGSNPGYIMIYVIDCNICANGLIKQMISKCWLLQNNGLILDSYFFDP